MPFSTARPSAFPASRPGRLWLTEGGIETEIMYKWGHDLPHFAMFPLLERADAAADIRGMYRRYLDVAARHGFAALIGGFDYRASPDWGALLGYSAEGLAEANLRVDRLPARDGAGVPRQPARCAHRRLRRPARRCLQR